MSENRKGRHWAFIVYPESAPVDWKAQIQATGCAFAVSPLHDQDINESTGEMKKSHYHCIISFSNTTTYNNVKSSVCEPINATIPQYINSVVGAVRYFTHLDNPEKAQYNISDIYTCNGFNLDDYKKLSYSQIQDIKFSITRYILENEILNYLDLVFIINDLNYDWRNVVMDNTIYFKEIIRSAKKKYKYSNTKEFDDI